MLPNVFSLKFAAGTIGATIAVYAISTRKLDFGGKYLGIVEDADGFGVDDVLKGATILFAGFVAANLVRA